MENNLTLFINNHSMQIEIPDAFSYCTLQSNNSLVLSIRDKSPLIVVGNDNCDGFIEFVDKLVDMFNCDINDLHYDDLEKTKYGGSYIGHISQCEGIDTIFINTPKFSLSGILEANYTKIPFKQWFNAICIIPSYDYDGHMSKLIFTYVKEKSALNNDNINCIDVYSLGELARIIKKNIIMSEFDDDLRHVNFDKLLAQAVEHAFKYNDYSQVGLCKIDNEFTNLCKTFVLSKLGGDV